MNINLYFSDSNKYMSKQMIYINLFQNIKQYINLIKYCIQQKCVTQADFELTYNQR